MGRLGIVLALVVYFSSRPLPIAAADTVPLLAISGLYDPFTPPEWADRGTAAFATRYLVTLPSAGHDTALSGACPIQIVSAFIAIQVGRLTWAV